MATNYQITGLKRTNWPITSGHIQHHCITGDGEIIMCHTGFTTVGVILMISMHMVWRHDGGLPKGWNTNPGHPADEVHVLQRDEV